MNARLSMFSFSSNFADGLMLTVNSLFSDLIVFSVIFSSVVVVNKEIREAILGDITANNYEVIGFTLTCSEETLVERHKKRGDKNECSFYWLHLKPLLGDYVINTDNKTVQQTVDEMKSIIDGEKDTDGVFNE